MSDTSIPPPLKRLRRLSVELLVRVACIASLVSMALMTWSVFDPTPFPVMVSMTVGQGIGTLALICYLAAVLVAQWRRDRTSSPPARGESKPT
jgi:hypothetical protein